MTETSDEWTEAEFFEWVAECREAADIAHQTLGLDGLHRRQHAILDKMMSEHLDPRPMSKWTFITLNVRSALLIIEQAMAWRLRWRW